MLVRMKKDAFDKYDKANKLKAGDVERRAREKHDKQNAVEHFAPVFFDHKCFDF